MRAVRPSSCLRPSTWVAAQLDALVAERDELRDLQELAAELLRPVEYEIVRLGEEDVGRAELANRGNLSPRQVKRVLEQARAKLRDGRATLRAQGRCRMLAQTIVDIRTGRIGPGDPGRQPGVTHLSRCWICRRTSYDGLDGAGRATGA